MPVEPGTGGRRLAFPVSSRRTTMLLAYPAELFVRTAVLIYALSGSGGPHHHATKKSLKQAVAKQIDWDRELRELYNQKAEFDQLLKTAEREGNVRLQNLAEQGKTFTHEVIKLVELNKAMSANLERYRRLSERSGNTQDRLLELRPVNHAPLPGFEWDALWPKPEPPKHTGRRLYGWRVDNRGMIRDAQRHSIGVWGVDGDEAGSQR